MFKSQLRSRSLGLKSAESEEDTESRGDSACHTEQTTSEACQHLFTHLFHGLVRPYLGLLKHF